MCPCASGIRGQDRIQLTGEASADASRCHAAGSNARFGADR